MNRAPIHRVLAALEHAGCSPHSAGSGWRARCPAHADKTPSLSIGIGRDGRTLIRCWAGCEVQAILEVLDLKWPDLFLRPVRRGRGA